MHKTSFVYSFEICLFSNILGEICEIAKTNNSMILKMNINSLTLLQSLMYMLIILIFYKKRMCHGEIKYHA